MEDPFSQIWSHIIISLASRRFSFVWGRPPHKRKTAARETKHIYPTEIQAVAVISEMEKTVTADFESSLEQQEQVLISNRDFIIKHLDADDVIDELIQARLIGKNAAQRIGLMTMSRIDKNRIIFEQLSIAGPGALKKFCDIFKKDERQTFIAMKIEQCK